MTKNTHNNKKTFTSRHTDILICLLLIFLTLSVYIQIKGHDFINLDDTEYVTDNRHVREGVKLKTISWAFSSTHASNWHPLTWLSHMMDCQLFGVDPGRHHLINLLLHIINTLLLFIVLKKMTGNLWQSGFVASLFAIHPLHVESVAWISERKDVLSTLFWMLTMWSYTFYVKAPGIKRYLPVFLFLALGLMSKPMLVTLPFVLILLDYWPLGRIRIHRSAINRRIFIEKIPLFVLVAISSAITFLVQKQGGAVSSLDAIPVNIRISNALVSYGAYIVKMVWPSKMAVLYPLSDIIPWWKILLSCTFLISMSYLAIRHIKKRPYISVGWFWYLGTLVPVIGIVQVGRQAMADRYTYIPLIGIFIIICWAASEVITRWRHIKTTVVAVATAIILVLTAVTFLQVRHWRNSITLFEHALGVTRGNYMSHNNLGIALQGQNKIKEAIGHFSEALRINSELWEIHYNLGNALEKQGKADEAIKHYLEALRINPDYEKAHNNLGNALEKQGRRDEAIKYYLEAIRINPGFAKAHYNLGVALKDLGQIDGAMKHFSEAVRINPDYEEAHNNLGVVLKKQGRVDEAIKHYLEAIRINPDFMEAHYNLGVALQNQGRMKEAIKHYSEAVRINPGFIEAYNNLGIALIYTGGIDKAIACFRNALKINPDSVQTKSNLNRALMVKSAKDK
jgi:protein O-mannosyl-transferase